MTTSLHTPDDELMQLARSADPLDDRDLPLDDADRLLREILAMPRVEPRQPALRRRSVRIVAVGAAAALAGGAAVAVIGSDGGEVTPASAAVVQHAIAALAQPPDTILHVDMTGTQQNGDGTTVTWRDESWQQNTAPYDRRQVETDASGTTVESANVGETEQVYDPSTNTVYSGAPTAAPRHKLWLTPGPRPGTYVLHPTLYRVSQDGTISASHAGRRGSVVITAAQLKALRNGTAVVRWKHTHAPGSLNGLKLTVVHGTPAAQPSDGADPDSSDFSRQILALLRSGGAYLVGHATVDGRDTLEIRSQDGHTTYYVDPDTYAPVELDTTGDGGGTSLRFTTWEELPATDANDALLSLTAQHPSATVDRSAADYQAAEERLFPNG